MSFETELENAQTLFGYDLAKSADLVAALRPRFEDLDAKEQALELVERNVHWKAEHHEGKPPRANYWKGTDPESEAKLVARHLTGLFQVATHINDIVDHPQWGPTALMGDFFADLNPRSDGLAMPVYYFGASGEPRWWIFEKPSDAPAFEQKLWDLQTVEGKDREKLLKSVVDGYPRARRWFGKNLERYGVKLDLPKKGFPDEGAPRLFAAYDALLPIARVLVSRGNAKGKARPTLAPTDVDAALAVAKKDAEYPPSALLQLVALALSDDPRRAEKEARAIVDKKLGVPLTQRWARMFLESKGPFST